MMTSVNEMFRQQGLRNPSRNGKRTKPKNIPLVESERFTDLGNARRFVRMHGQKLRYCWPWKKWLCWDDRRWCEDETGAVQALAKETIEGMYRQAAELPEEQRQALASHAISTEKNAARIKAMIDLARSEPNIPILPSALDNNPWVFNCMNGTINLKTGELQQHNPDDYITKLSPVKFDASATCPKFQCFVNEIFGGDDELVVFVQRLFGYTLTGDVSEQVLPIFWGKGANGKSTLLGAIMATQGSDYAIKAAPDLFVVKRNDSHPTDKADLFGKRLVVGIETDENRRLAESLIKDLTGGDNIRARRMREDFWEFPPTHKLILCTNHKPIIRGTDHAIWRRVRLVPFIATIDDDKQDKDLPKKLMKELPGILAWCVSGCLEWQRIGLGAPETIKAATKDYRSEQDVIGRFIAERCRTDANAKVRAGELYTQYMNWCKATGEYPATNSVFGTRLSDLGFETKRSGGIWRLGLDLLAEEVLFAD